MDEGRGRERREGDVARFYMTEGWKCSWCHFTDRTIQKRETDQSDAQPVRPSFLSRFPLVVVVVCVLEHEGKLNYKQCTQG